MIVYTINWHIERWKLCWTRKHIHIKFPLSKWWQALCYKIHSMSISNEIKSIQNIRSTDLIYIYKLIIEFKLYFYQPKKLHRNIWLFFSICGKHLKFLNWNWMRILCKMSFKWFLISFFVQILDQYIFYIVKQWKFILFYDIGEYTLKLFICFWNTLLKVVLSLK